ncbi:MAG: DUF2029 domain-containing protein [Chloroflexi bacterium]|nr:DUF2029 domain-containing protein [Chloroflexota bacterium]
MTRTYVLRILALFVSLLVIYLLIAGLILAPAGYYGSIEQPRFADPWIARGETILGGGLLYRDVFTTTPPLTNYLLIPPVLMSSLFGHRNPGSTLSFMVYFSLFDLMTAYVLLFTVEDRSEGYRSAVWFLLNPLTFGNAILRRQDESILVFFLGLALLFMLHSQHGRASLTVGLALLIKLTGALLLPVAFLRTRNWRYLVIPAAVFALAVVPFLLMAGRAAVFWDPAQTHTEHPFQLGGISLSALWWRIRGEAPGNVAMSAYSALFVIGVLATVGLIAWKPSGLLEDTTLLTTAVLLLSPKLHCGYLSFLALMMAPLARKYRLSGLYFACGALAVVADMYKWPVENFALAFTLMIVVYLVLIVGMARMRWTRRAPFATQSR